MHGDVPQREQLLVPASVELDLAAVEPFDQASPDAPGIQDFLQVRPRRVPGLRRRVSQRDEGDVVLGDRDDRIIRVDVVGDPDLPADRRIQAIDGPLHDASRVRVRGLIEAGREVLPTERPRCGIEPHQIRTVLGHGRRRQRGRSARRLTLRGQELGPCDPDGGRARASGESRFDEGPSRGPLASARRLGLLVHSHDVRTSPVPQNDPFASR